MHKPSFQLNCNLEDSTHNIFQIAPQPELTWIKIKCSGWPGCREITDDNSSTSEMQLHQLCNSQKSAILKKMIPPMHLHCWKAGIMRFCKKHSLRLLGAVQVTGSKALVSGIKYGLMLNDAVKPKIQRLMQNGMVLIDLRGVFCCPLYIILYIYVQSAEKLFEHLR